MNILAQFKQNELVALEESFMEQTLLDGYYLQQPNKGEGFWLASTQDDYESWVLKCMVEAMRDQFEEVK